MWTNKQNLQTPNYFFFYVYLPLDYLYIPLHNFNILVKDKEMSMKCPSLMQKELFHN